MDAYAEGNTEAFAVVYDELADRLYAYVLGMVRVASVAEEILQQAFLRMHQARGSFAPKAPVEPWAFAIARRLTIDWLRSEKSRWDQVASPEDMLYSGPDPELATMELELTDAFRRELEVVPLQLREAFWLVRVEGFSLADAAGVLGTTAVAVKMRAHRAGVLLRTRLSRFRVTGELTKERSG